MATENRETRLQKLSKSDYEMADGQPDIRDWDVMDSEGKRIGEVDELIFDVQSLKVRYMVVDLENNEFDLDSKHVLVPIGLAELHKSGDDVILPGITAEQLRSLPEYDEDAFDADHERTVRGVFDDSRTPAMSGTPDNKDFYDHDHFNEDNLYRNRKSHDTDDNTTIPVVKEELQIGKREVETGGIRLRSRVVAEEVAEDINLRQEEVKVETTPVNRPATEDDLQESTLESRAYKEVPVVSKEARVVEEISLNKEVTEKEHTVSDTVRNTEIDIDRDTEKEKF